MAHRSCADVCVCAPGLHAQAAVSQDYIGGLALSPDGHAVLVAAADGAASLLDARKGGARLASVACGSPLRCAATDGCLALLGSEGGQVGRGTEVKFCSHGTWCHHKYTFPAEPRLG